MNKKLAEKLVVLLKERFLRGFELFEVKKDEWTIKSTNPSENVDQRVVEFIAGYLSAIEILLGSKCTLVGYKEEE